MTVWQAIVLGIVEGLTEFLPVSSTGHMIIASSIMGIASDDFTKTFTITIQLGAILSVLVLYWRKFFPGGVSVLRNIDFYKKLLIAFLPSVIAGIFFKPYIEILLENVIVVAISLFCGGIIFIMLDKWFAKAEKHGKEELKSDSKALKIGLFQVISMIPGVSRSAATIIGGLSQGLNKKAAAEFSFFLAVPTMFGATVKDLWDFYQKGGGFKAEELQLLAIGNLVAFVVAMLAIKSFISFLTRHGFKAFGYYRIIAGGLILILHWLGIELSML
ncbi:MAG: undecaprenyl-diphosphate phosphatase [Bacteroidetes bacterium]|nr:MAG: undecaprenyl-diphosphate phosphatase [Bacteroidota bacterium]REK04784.1 MAG: undecaprenyl-diphosphate phosphatase [Bacteroidota bacterium]REK36257.1 MAG: undecaprenyl-diphosphate phosphatase [Bacteroidota bacterium]REK51080.1 MAG: undecaprenyl-diphosphate phosphatase [Bacteroidota bacterium]